MEKAFAYICTAADTAPRLLKRYCRKVYELGYVPICPKLNDGQYLALDNADEKRDFHNIARQKLGRCRMLVVCGKEISNSMSAEIGLAKSGTSSAPHWMVWPESKKKLNKLSLDSVNLCCYNKSKETKKFVTHISLLSTYNRKEKQYGNSNCERRKSYEPKNNSYIGKAAVDHSAEVL